MPIDFPECCQKCGLYKSCITYRIDGAGSNKPAILFVGEAPGEDEDLQGKPFVGKAGKVLRNAVQALELEPNEYRFTNIVRCRPPDNRTPTAKEIQACSGFLVDEIAHYKPRVVVLLGNSPLRAVLGETGITNWNGVIVNRDDIVYIPAFHPSYLARGNMSALEDWMRALNKAVEIIDGDEDLSSAEDDYQIFYPTTISELDIMRDSLTSVSNEYISYDTEVKWLSEFIPNNKVLSVSFANEKFAWSVPVDHDEANWNAEERDYLIHDVISYILNNANVIGHNIRFDWRVTRGLLGVDFKPFGDTMLISQLVDSKRGIHGLKRLAGLHLGMFDYDKELEDYKDKHPEADYKCGGHYGNVPLKTLLPYGALDAIATWKLYPVLYAELTELQKVFYRELFLPADRALGIMEINGVKLDYYVARRYKILYELVQSRYYAELLNDADVQRYVEHRRTMVPDSILAKFNEVYNGGKLPKYVEDWNGDAKFEFNPNSADQVSAVFYVYKGHEILGRTSTGNPSIASDVLKNSTVANDDIYESYRRWKLLASMQSKYLDKASSGEWDVGGDGRVHADFNLGGTKTGRLSSAHPNMQNIPTPEKEPGTLLAQLPIKNIFTHTYDGGCLVALDYSGMELRTIASIANCRGMIESFENNQDIHCYVTRMVFPDEIPANASDKVIKHQYKEVRYKAKWTNWTLLYGGDAHTLYRLYGLSKDEANHIVDAYYGRFPEILDYRRRTLAFAEEWGYVETPFGRRLYLPYIRDGDTPQAAAERRTAINMPIQSLASDILLCAIVVITDKLQQQGFKTMLVNTVHDSIVGDVYPGELDDFISLCVDVMEGIAGYAKVYFPNLDFSWLKVPLVVDVEVGSHYGALEEYHVMSL